MLIGSEEDGTANGFGQDTDIVEAAQAVKTAIENNEVDGNADPDDKMRKLAQHSKEDDDDDENEEDTYTRAKETPLSGALDDVLSTFSPLLRPLENLAFGRLMKRGRGCGALMGRAVSKIMNGALAYNDGEGQRPKLSFMANSLGAHTVSYTHLTLPTILLV